ncbi:MAG: sulfotransferase family 2 domain-containing protein [Ardenticatenaceae bacterium]
MVSQLMLVPLVQRGYRRICHLIQRIRLKMAFIPPEWFCFHEYDPRMFYILDKQKLVYLAIPKVATTSILLTISESYGLKIKRGLIHSNPFWHCQLGKLNKAQTPYHKFTFIRNPFDRLVSCYKEKIVNRYNRKLPPFYNGPHLSVPENASFAQFVQIVSDTPDCLADRHFKSQYAILYRKNNLLVDWVGRFEHLAENWAELAEKYNLRPHLLHKLSSHNFENTPRDYKLYYTREFADMVYKRYQKDVDLLGYSDAYQELLGFIESQRSEK